MKKPFLTLAQAKEIIKTYPTPFHIYDEKGIRENARHLKAAFSLRSTSRLRPPLPPASSSCCGKRGAAWTAPPSPN